MSNSEEKLKCRICQFTSDSLWDGLCNACLADEVSKKQKREPEKPDVSKMANQKKWKNRLYFLVLIVCFPLAILSLGVAIYGFLTGQREYSVDGFTISVISAVVAYMADKFRKFN